MRRILGYFLLSLPFILLLGAMFADIGFTQGMLVIGFVSAVVGCVLGGMKLAFD